MTSVVSTFLTYSSIGCLFIGFRSNIGKWGTCHDYVLQWYVPTINQMVTPNQMLFLRGSIGPVSAISELRSILSHSYKITTSFTSSVNSLHEQIFIVRLLSPGGVIAYVPEFCRAVVDKSCRILPLIWGFVGKGIAEHSPPSFSSR